MWEADENIKSLNNGLIATHMMSHDNIIDDLELYNMIYCILSSYSYNIPCGTNFNF